MNTNIIPTLRYREAKEAIRWLCSTFGFKEYLVVPGEGDHIEHAQLTFGSGMIMLSSVKGDDFDKLQAPPLSTDEVVCQSPYIIISETEIDAHYQRTVEFGAKIVMPLVAEDYGGKNYSCRDPEGYLWNFGSYNPWATT